jgi:hypothetical protein
LIKVLVGYEKLLLSDSLVSKTLLPKLSDGEFRIEVCTPYHQPENQTPLYSDEFVNDFLNFLVTLMIGVEGSRNNVSMVTSIMALELVKYDKFSFKEMFHDPSYGYGGQYSMANRNITGPKFKNYRAVLEDAEQYQLAGGSLRHKRNDPLFAVPVKDAVTIKNWLKMKEIDYRTMTRNEFLVAYQDAVTALIEKYYFHTPQFTIR